MQNFKNMPIFFIFRYDNTYLVVLEVQVDVLLVHTLAVGILVEAVGSLVGDVGNLAESRAENQVESLAGNQFAFQAVVELQVVVVGLRVEDQDNHPVDS